MTEYGRGRGSEPWHPEDPLFSPGYGQEGGDGYAGWDGQQATGGSAPYGDPQYQQYPGQHQPWDGAPYRGQQQYPQPDQPGQGYGWGGQPDGGGGYGQGGPYGQPADPYGYQQQPYDGGQYDAQQHPYDPQQYDQQYAPRGYEPGPQGQQHYDPQGGHPRQQGQEPAADWAQEPDGPEHAFFADQPDNAAGNAAGGGRRGGGDDRGGRAAREDGRSGGYGEGPGQGDFDRDDDRDAYDDHDEPRDSRGRGGKPKKRRSGTACLLVTVVLVGGVGTVGYFAYDFYQSRFGPAPDFAGEGTGSVQVEIPAGAGLGEMGRILKAAEVVKSAQAFVDAANDNPKGATIQAGVYSMKKEMSGEAAVALMLSPESRNSLIIPEGTRNAQVYALIDDKLELEKGTTRKVAKEQADQLGLPEWADDNDQIKDPLEGFLYPARYDAGEGAKPEDVLRDMVARAKAEYTKHDLEGEARKLKLDSPLQLLTVASLVQAEGKTREDFGKMARVVYNRLEPANSETNGKLEFDSAYNYLKGQSKIDIGIDEIRSDDDPYNTYYHRGLPPGPIGNPGKEALDAAADPAPGEWYYFVAVDGENTQFAETHEEHEKLRQEFNANRKNKG